MNEFDKINYKNHEITIFYDESPQSPDDWGNEDAFLDGVIPLRDLPHGYWQLIPLDDTQRARGGFDGWRAHATPRNFFFQNMAWSSSMPPA